MTAPDELERLARAATPGPWIRSGCRRKMGDEDCIMVGPDGFLMAALPIGQPRDHAGAFNDAAFIAAANPATILALLSERAELLAAVERMRGEMAGMETRLRRWEPRVSLDLSVACAITRAALTTGEATNAGERA